MKAYVITIMSNPLSVSAAERCIKSAKKFGLDVKMWKAFTPKDNPRKILTDHGINPKGFEEVYSRLENCMSAFLSHYSLWQESFTKDENILILEHDAVIKSEMPKMDFFSGCISFGKPSYGKFNIPSQIGRNKLQSKQYFPGAHAYLISSRAAKIVIEKAKTEAAPTDVFFHNDRFDFLEEWYPWPVEAVDSFTTIQKREGCLAKHNFGETYEIV